MPPDAYTATDPAVVRISDVAKAWAEKLPNHTALVDPSGSWAYSELAAAITQTQSWLDRQGIRPGDRVMLVCENCRAFVAVLLGIAGLGAWPVLINARLSAREVDEIQEHCGARCAIYMSAVSPHAAEHAKRHVATTQMVPHVGFVDISPLDVETKPERLELDSKRNVAALIYTSGTTGLPKGVMLTHGNLLFLAGVSAKIRRLTPDDRLYGVLPMSHAVGLSVVLLGGLLSGATIYLTPRFDPISARASLEKDQITVMLGVPSMFSQLLDYAKLRGVSRFDLPALRIISSSGAPLDAALKERVEQVFGLTLHNGYGVTECSPTISQANVDVHSGDTSVGEVLLGTEVKLVDSKGQQVPAGEIGELWVRGPHVMKGYYRAPEETARAIDPEGWFNTRDLARLERNNLFIMGRTKELIIRFGFNVYPPEVEAVLHSHPGVARAAVIGRPAAGNAGEDVIAFVQARPGSALTSKDVGSYAAKHLAAYKQPSNIFVLEELPLTPTGKVAKDKLVKMMDDVSTFSAPLT